MAVVGHHQTLVGQKDLFDRFNQNKAPRFSCLSVIRLLLLQLVLKSWMIDLAGWRSGGLTDCGVSEFFVTFVCVCVRVVFDHFQAATKQAIKKNQSKATKILTKVCKTKQLFIDSLSFRGGGGVSVELFFFLRTVSSFLVSFFVAETTLVARIYQHKDLLMAGKCQLVWEFFF